MLQGKRILLGVGGGIAVYRAIELMRLLMKEGAEVQVVMTKSACEFVAPLTFEALSGKKVHTDLFDLTEEHGMGHIQLARWADVLILAPATANLITKLARGIAEDLLTTLFLARDIPALIAPAMNVAMWEAEATQTNLEILQNRGVSIIEPVAGVLACGEQGAGRLAEPEMILQAVLPLLTVQTLAGQTWVMNAGPTVESWDAVRTMSNRASGRLGAKLADAASIRGANVILIAGPHTPQTRQDVQRVDVESAAQMYEACLNLAQGTDVFVGMAAVSDFRFSKTHVQKLKREGGASLQVELTENPDIIAAIASMNSRPSKVVAFAAESENHLEYAKTKLENKGVDAIVANDISNMASEKASGWWVSPSDVQEMPTQPKQYFVSALIHHIIKL
ncbi:MAG: bifunctional phosphopantothenoylcysteine decarboxylase/phosphopantothenate--cysteine ligase CoaBC [Ghiorsea sp.]